jgi:predicted  nucleic acid-binding Zn-ribbon protein
VTKVADPEDIDVEKLKAEIERLTAAAETLDRELGDMSAQAKAVQDDVKANAKQSDERTKLLKKK